MHCQLTIYKFEDYHYYPFGLTMRGISSKAAGGIENKKKYQGYESNIDFDLNTYESFFRVHDPQIGRWWQIDPKPESSLELSPYVVMNNNPITVIDILGDITSYERGENVTRKQFREFKREIRQMRNNSKAFNSMYKDMKHSRDKFVFKALSTGSGGETKKPWDPGQNGVTTIQSNVNISKNKQLGIIGHEIGHAWRILQKLDIKPTLLGTPAMPGINGNWDEYNKQNDYVKGQNLLTTMSSREQAEKGAMHLGNIVKSELMRSGDPQYSNLELEHSYFGPTAVKGTSSFGNPTYKPDYKDYTNIASADYYNNSIDIYEEHGVKPIK